MLSDGLSGSAKIAEAAPQATDIDVDINTVVLNTTDTDLVPVGARFTVNTAGSTTTYIVTHRTGLNEVQTIGIGDTVSGGNFTLTYESEETGNIAYDANAADVKSALEALVTIGANNVDVTGGPGPASDWVVEFINAEGEQDCEMLTGNGANLTGDGTDVNIAETVKGDPNQTTNIEFSPAWGAATPAQEDVITFTSQQLQIKIGEGNITWSEAHEYEYLLDRGDLDTVKEGDEQPLEISLEFVYEHITSGTDEDITPVDALKKQNEASEWVSSAADACEPYAVDIVVLHCVPCGGDEDEKVTFADFRYEALEFDLGEATIAVSGRCNKSEVTVLRGNFDECN